MKSLLLIPLIIFTNLPAQGRQSQAGWSEQCFKTVYHEEYVPGTSTSRGYVRSWTEKVETDCRPSQTEALAPQPTRTQSYDTNSCIEGSLIGGILGGAAGGVLSTQDNWIWSIPTGVVGGALVGCQVDGG